MPSKRQLKVVRFLYPSPYISILPVNNNYEEKSISKNIVALIRNQDVTMCEANMYPSK
jgi:hypothetical protein